MNSFKALLLSVVILLSCASIIANEPNQQPQSESRQRYARSRRDWYLHASREQLARELAHAIPSDAALEAAINSIAIHEKNTTQEQSDPNALR